MVPLRDRSVSQLSKEQFCKIALTKNPPKSRLRLHGEVQAALSVYRRGLCGRVRNMLEAGCVSSEEIGEMFNPEYIASSAYDSLQRSQTMQPSIENNGVFQQLWPGLGSYDAI